MYMYILGLLVVHVGNHVAGCTQHNQIEVICIRFAASFQYYKDANEADAWMNEKAGIAANQDYGRDEDAATKALRKHKV